HQQPGHRAGVIAFQLRQSQEITMGWLYMQSLNGHTGPRQYLDAQFTYQHPTVTSRVLRSSLVKMRVYYAAVEHVLAPTGTREVWGAVCLVAYNPRDRDGYIFGYKLDFADFMPRSRALL